MLKWDTVIEQTVSELGGFCTGRKPSLDFLKLAPKLERQDERELRAKIRALTVSQAKQLGIGKSTLHYLRLRAQEPHYFRKYNRLRRRLVAKETCPE